MEEKPKIYHRNISKEINNNLSVYNGYNESPKKIDIIKTNDIRNKIKHIINSNSFIYRKLVYIKIKNDIISRKIIGINGNNLVTIDNEYIPLDNISDIYIKK